MATVPPLKVADYDGSKLTFVPVDKKKKGKDGKPLQGISNVYYGGQPLLLQLANLTVSSKFPGYWDQSAVRKDGQAGNYVYEKSESELPLVTDRLRVNVDIRNARLVGSKLADFPEPEDAKYCRAIYDLFTDLARRGGEANEKEWRALSKMPPAVSVQSMLSTNIYDGGDSIDDDPIRIDENGVRRVKTLNVTFTLYLDPRQDAADPVISNSCQVFRITGWEQVADPETGEIVNRKPKVEDSTVYKNLVGGCKGFYSIEFGSSSVSQGRIGFTARLKKAFTEDSKWGRKNENVDAETAASGLGMAW